MQFNVCVMVSETIFKEKKGDMFFLISDPNIYLGGSSKPNHRGGSNEHPHFIL